jgi:hypothetical protein
MATHQVGRHKRPERCNSLGTDVASSFGLTNPPEHKQIPLRMIEVLGTESPAGNPNPRITTLFSAVAAGIGLQACEMRFLKNCG